MQPTAFAAFYAATRRLIKPVALNHGGLETVLLHAEPGGARLSIGSVKLPVKQPGFLPAQY